MVDEDGAPFDVEPRNVLQPPLAAVAPARAGSREVAVELEF